MLALFFCFCHPTPAGIIRVPYRTYGPPGSTQPTKFIEFIPTPRFPKKWCFVEFKICFGFVIFRLIWIMPHSWVSFYLSLFKTYGLLMPHSWIVFAYVISQTYDLWPMTFSIVIFQFQFVCSGFLVYFVQICFKDQFDIRLTNSGTYLMVFNIK